MDSNYNSSRNVPGIVFDATDFLEPVPAIPTHFHHSPFLTDLLSCKSCEIAAEAQRVVPASGPLNAPFMVLGRNPGRDEDVQGQPFIGPGGRELDIWLEILGLDRQKLMISNACKCHTRGDRPPRTKEMMICTELWLRKEIAQLPNLRVIFALGNDVARFILGGDLESTGTLRFYSARVKLEDRYFDVVPLAHPGYLIRARHKMDRMHNGVLPQVKEFLIKNHPVSYANCTRV